MKIYSIKDIVKVDEFGIEFRDGFQISFEQCRYEWAISHSLSLNESKCVATRSSIEDIPYFMFYDTENVKIEFDERGIFAKKRNEKKFLDLQIGLNRFGYSSYDCS